MLTELACFTDRQELHLREKSSGTQSFFLSPAGFKRKSIQRSFFRRLTSLRRRRMREMRKRVAADVHKLPNDSEKLVSSSAQRAAPSRFGTAALIDPTPFFFPFILLPLFSSLLCPPGGEDLVQPGEKKNLIFLQHSSQIKATWQPQQQ